MPAPRPSPSFSLPRAAARRAISPPSLDLKALIAEHAIAYHGFNELDFAQHGFGLLFSEVRAISSLMRSPGLRVPLSAAYGKRDAMVDGAYSKAHLFIFETDSFYFWCRSESVDRGAIWFLADKNQPLPAAKQSYCTDRHFDDPRQAGSAEALAFIDSLFIGMALAHPPTKALVERSMPRVHAALEARELSERTPAASRAPPSRALRV